jgi:hypothetical protein
MSSVDQKTPSKEILYDAINGSAEAIVVHCADPRFQKAFREFINKELKLEEGKYIPIVISGAVASLSEPSSFPKEFKVVSDLIDLFLTRHNSIKMIVLINHEDCKKYEAMKGVLGRLFLGKLATIAEKQKKDLVSVALNLLQMHKQKPAVRLFYGKFANDQHSQIAFEEVVFSK